MLARLALLWYADCMTRPGDLLRKLRNRYVAGLAVGLILTLFLLAFAVLGHLAALGIVALLGGGEEAVWGWFQLTAFIWAPLAVGTATHGIIEHVGPLIREQREAERKADLARFVEGAR